MSGGSGGYVPEIKNSQDTICERLSITVLLTNPIPEVTATLKAGEILEVIKVAPSSIQVFNKNGELVGSLLTRDRDRIIKCIDDGYEFIAVILRITGANCEVQIKTK